MSAGGNLPTINHAGRVEPIAEGRSDAARVIESKAVTAASLQWAIPRLSPANAARWAVIIEQARVLHGEAEAVLMVRKLARRLNR